MLIDFLICGTQKGGTSALAAYLRQHPNIQLALRKEVHYFDEDAHFTTAKPDYRVYHQAFQSRQPGVILGEATPNYMYWREAPARIQLYNPAMKIIVILRNPIERAYSHWNMQRAQGREPKTFAAALDAESARRLTARPQQDIMFSYLDRGFYAVQLHRLWASFKPAQVLILSSDQLRTARGYTLATVFAFLGVQPLRLPALSCYQTPYLAPMGTNERRFLQYIYTPEIRELERLLHWDCSPWLEPIGLDDSKLARLPE